MYLIVNLRLLKKYLHFVAMDTKKEGKMNLFVWFWNNVVKKQDDSRIATLAVPKAQENNSIPYISDGDPYHLLDVYAPLESHGKMPTIIDIHGGGWYYGDKELNKIYCLNLANLGFKVINISYRLTPYVSLKEQIQDISSAINYVYDNADNLGVDLNNLFLAGDSAGAHCAGLIVNLQQDEDMQKVYECSVKANFKAVCYICAAFNIKKLATAPIVRLYFKPLLGKKAKKNPLFPYSSFREEYATHVPAIFITCDGDFLRNQTISGYERLSTLKADTELVYFKKENQTNKLAHVYNVVQPYWEESKEANAKTVAFFNKYID